MCFLFVLMLILQFSISFPAVAGDCYDEPPNNKSCDNCATCYQTLANALLNSGDNKYQLGRAFFPEDADPPVVVKAVYVMKNVQDSQCEQPLDDNTSCTCADANTTPTCADANTTNTWYWLAGEMYIYQAMEIFSYRSLFFSPPKWRQECVVLCLPEPCLPMNDSSTSEEFFKFLTQRVCCPYYNKVYIYNLVKRAE